MKVIKILQAGALHTLSERTGEPHDVTFAHQPRKQSLQNLNSWNFFAVFSTATKCDPKTICP